MSELTLYPYQQIIADVSHEVALAARRKNSPRPAPTKVVRDGTFCRAVVDQVVVIDLGRDMELACIQFGPELVSITDHGEHEKIDLSPVLTEVARLRLPLASSVALAMHILEKGIRADKIRGDNVVESISGWVAEMKDSDETDGENNGK